MTIVRLFLAALLSATLCLSAVPATSFAASGKDTVKTEKKASTAKKSTKKKAVPKNIDINSADKDLLVMLPGIGPKTADSILKYRKANGPFSSTADLVNVKGIGKKTLAKISPYLKKV